MGIKRALGGMLVCAIAQQGAAPPRQQVPTFRTGVSLVTIDVTVLDPQGKPVEGLTAADIDIKLDGRSQPIRAFAFVQAAQAATAPAAAVAVAVTPPPAAAPAPALASSSPETPRRTIDNMSSGAAAPAPAAPAAAASSASSAEPRVFVLLVDDLSFSPQRGKALFTAAQRFLDRVPASDPVGFATTSGPGAVNPTRDRAVIRAALARAAGQFSDPRMTATRGPGVGIGPGGSPDSPLAFTEAIDIDRGDDALLREVIVRECYNGNRQAIVSQSLEQVIAENACASGVRIEARQTAAQLRQNKGRQIAGIKNVIGAMKGGSGIRHLVLLSDGMPVSREVDELRPMVREAAEAGVQLSVLLEEPDLNANEEGRRAMPIGSPDSPQADPGMSRRRREDALLLVNGLQTMTDLLGGHFHRVVGTPDPSFDRVIAASSGVYRLGVELPAGARPGTSFDVTASVKRSGVTTRVNRFVVAAAPAATTETAPAPAPAPKPAAPAATGSVDDMLKAALNVNRQASGVPIRMGAYVRRSRNAEGQVDVAVDVTIPGSVAGPITTYVGVVDATGAVRSTKRMLTPSDGADYTTSFLFPLPPGEYRVRYAAADAARTLGTIEVPVRASLPAFGPYTAGDVLTWYVDSYNNSAQLFAVEDIPQGLTEVRASLEIESAAPGGEAPTIRWTLTREGESAPVHEFEFAADKSATGYRADVEFPLATLAPGRYVIRAALIANGQPVASRAAVIKK